MFIHRHNLSQMKTKRIIIERQIHWVCLRINSIIKVDLEAETSLFGDIKKHLLDKILINKYHLTKILYKTLKNIYKELLNDYKQNSAHKIYTFVMYRTYE